MSLIEELKDIIDAKKEKGEEVISVAEVSKILQAMRKLDVVPMKGFILIEPEKTKKKHGKIIIPETIRKETTVGTIVKSSIDELDDGVMVIYDKLGTDKLSWKGKSYVLASEGSILATIE